MTDIKPHPDGGSVLQMGITAQQRLTAMLATWDAKRQFHLAAIHMAQRNEDTDSADEEHRKLRDLDASVINALCSMIRLGGLAMADNQDPPSLIVHTPHLTYGVSVLRQIGMQWSVDS